MFHHRNLDYLKNIASTNECKSYEKECGNIIKIEPRLLICLCDPICKSPFKVVSEDIRIRVHIWIHAVNLTKLEC